MFTALVVIALGALGTLAHARNFKTSPALSKGNCIAVDLALLQSSK
jgi:hypothetical protein